MRTLHPIVVAAAAVLAALTACSSDRSAPRCALNSDCQVTETCVEGACTPECREDRDCSAGASCRGAVCVPEEAEDSGGDASADSPVDSEVVLVDVLSEATDAPSDDSLDTGGDAPDLSADVIRDDGPRPDGTGALTGQVHFRLYDDTDLPVAEPVVYWTMPGEAPEPLRRGATCDCDFPENATRGDTEGRFVLDGVPAGDVLLVVQKGRFRRVRPVVVTADTLVEVPRAVTELPTHQAPEAGDEVPNIVVGTGRFDPIEDVFAKLRMLPITSRFGVDYRAYLADPAAWSVTLMHYQDPGEFDREELADINWAATTPSLLDLFADGDRLRGFDFAFSPCASTQDYATALTSAPARASIRAFVNEGGNLYVTDYAYDVVEQVFPEYVDFTAPDGSDRNANGAVGDPTRMSIATHDTRRYASPNKALTPALRQWLLALDAAVDGLIETHGNWVNVRAAGSGTQCCRDGLPVTVPAEVVMSGPNYEDRGGFVGEGVHYDSWAEAELDAGNHPHTLRFPFGCGEVMYSTYHTTEFFERTAGLSPQELVLLYLILELSMCTADPVKE